MCGHCGHCKTNTWYYIQIKLFIILSISYIIMDAYIVGAVRTAGAKKNGRLREWHPISLGAAVLDALVDRTGIDASQIDDVIVG
jgi:hypothetical protein